MNYFLIFLSFLFLNGAAERNELTVTISNIKHVRGSIEIGLFNTGERFLEEGQAYKSISVEVNDTSETLTIKNLPDGVYAISLYHDVNSNGRCDRNFLGIPKEPYAFSNNFRPKFSPPSFEDCQFQISGDHSLEIKLLH